MTCAAAGRRGQACGAAAGPAPARPGGARGGSLQHRRPAQPVHQFLHDLQPHRTPGAGARPADGVRGCRLGGGPARAALLRRNPVGHRSCRSLGLAGCAGGGSRRRRLRSNWMLRATRLCWRRICSARASGTSARLKAARCSRRLIPCCCTIPARISRRDALRSAYRALGASEKLRVVAARLPEEELVRWVSAVEPVNLLPPGPCANRGHGQELNGFRGGTEWRRRGKTRTGVG